MPSMPRAGPRRTALTDNEEPSGKRPRSSMTPVIVFKDGQPYLTAGSPGGSQIIGIVGQSAGQRHRSSNGHPAGDQRPAPQQPQWPAGSGSTLFQPRRVAVAP